MNRRNLPGTEYFKSESWIRKKTAYLEEVGLCEICRMEKDQVLADDVYLSIPLRQLQRMDLSTIDQKNMIAVCRKHRGDLHKGKYKLDPEGNLIRSERGKG